MREPDPSINASVINGEAYPALTFKEISEAETYYEFVMSRIPDGYVRDPISDLYPRRNYLVCSECEALGSIKLAPVEIAYQEAVMAYSCSVCEYRLWVVTSQPSLRRVAKYLGIDAEWHEPDNYEVTALARGSKFDNAGNWPKLFGEDSDGIATEMHVLLRKDGKDVAVVNVLDLMAWACENNG